MVKFGNVDGLFCKRLDVLTPPARPRPPAPPTPTTFRSPYRLIVVVDLLGRLPQNIIRSDSAGCEVRKRVSVPARLPALPGTGPRRPTAPRIRKQTLLHAIYCDTFYEVRVTRERPCLVVYTAALAAASADAVVSDPWSDRCCCAQICVIIVLYMQQKKNKQLAAFFCPDLRRGLCEREGEVSACASCRSPVGHSEVDIVQIGRYSKNVDGLFYSALTCDAARPARPARPAPPTPTTFRSPYRRENVPTDRFPCFYLLHKIENHMQSDQRGWRRDGTGSTLELEGKPKIKERGKISGKN
ncbi:hypothetical protein EVAR_103503_1 [Eumeta japonica]|uniref:Uncharacterized protein n=1 Tax=Eumeta variegata TaxID=151549 RepID=A0A4C1YSG3_EUMVA|nr:hypothetical protein EVAR_103503_1 [Eumeta japonica]